MDLFLCACVFRLSARVYRPLTGAEAGAGARAEAGAAAPCVNTCKRNGFDIYATDHSLDGDIVMAMFLTFTRDAM